MKNRVEELKAKLDKSIEKGVSLANLVMLSQEIDDEINKTNKNTDID